MTTDARDQLADALRHHRRIDAYDGHRETYYCAGCVLDAGADEHREFATLDDFDAHVADVLLSLPGIAVIPRDALPDHEDLWDANQCVRDWRESDNCDDTPENLHRLSLLADRLRDKANTLAAAVLAERKTQP